MKSFDKNHLILSGPINDQAPEASPGRKLQRHGGKSLSIVLGFCTIMALSPGHSGLRPAAGQAPQPDYAARAVPNGGQLPNAAAVLDAEHSLTLYRSSVTPDRNRVEFNNSGITSPGGVQGSTSLQAPVIDGAGRRYPYSFTPCEGGWRLAMAAEGAAADGHKPYIKRLSAGLGGHHLALARGGGFPVICGIAAGDEDYRGKLVLRTSGLTWETECSVRAGRTERVEVDGFLPGSINNIVVQAGDLRPGSYSVELEGVEGSAQPFELTADGAGDGGGSIYWVTNAVFGASAETRVFSLISSSRPGRGAPQIPIQAGSEVPPDEDGLADRVEVISPDLLPKTAAAWDRAKVVILGSDIGSIGPEASSALQQWTANGGVIVRMAGSSQPDWMPQNFLRAAAASSGFPSQVARIPFGAGWVLYYPNLMDPSSPVAAGHRTGPVSGQNWLQWALALPKEYVKPSGLPTAQPAANPGVDAPGWVLFALLLVVYALLFGPVSLALIKKVRRVLLAWLVVPAAAMIFTLIVIAAGSVMKINRPILNVNEMVTIVSGGSTGQGAVECSLFSPDAGQLTIPDSGLLVSSADGPAKTWVNANGSGSAVILDDLQSYGIRQFSLEGTVHVPAGFVIYPESGGFRLSGPATWQARTTYILQDGQLYKIPPFSGAAFIKLADVGRGDFNDLLLQTGIAHGPDGHTPYWILPDAIQPTVTGLAGFTGVKRAALCVIPVQAPDDVPAASNSGLKQRADKLEEIKP